MSNTETISSNIETISEQSDIDYFEDAEDRFDEEITENFPEFDGSQGNNYTLNYTLNNSMSDQSVRVIMDENIGLSQT